MDLYKTAKPVVMLDVDETVVENIDDWAAWYKNKTGFDLKLDGKNTENLQKALLEHKLNPLDYWKQPDLYDKKIPITKAGKVISKYKEDYQFVFVSNCFPEHINSKKVFLNRWFGDIPFINTHYKEYIKCDIVVDDRAYYLRQIKDKQPNAECIQIITSVNNFHEEYYYFRWDDIDDYLSNYLVQYRTTQNK